jgi:hypothetical protein
MRRTARRMLRRDVTWPGSFMLMFGLGVIFVGTGNRILYGLIALIGIAMLIDIGRTMGKDSSGSG